MTYEGGLIFRMVAIEKSSYNHEGLTLSTTHSSITPHIYVASLHQSLRNTFYTYE
jgi:uncharacterized integral membrane protein